MTWRPDAILDLVDAMTISGHINSPVALSESPLFRHKFSSVYDTLKHGRLEVCLQDLLSDSQDETWEKIAGYEIHAIDATPNERMAAETLPDRGALKAQQKEPARYGHKYSWLVRLVQGGWVRVGLFGGNGNSHALNPTPRDTDSTSKITSISHLPRDFLRP